MQDPRVEELKRELDSVRDQLASLRTEQTTGFGDINARLDTMNGTVAKIKAEIGPGLPEPDERGDRPTIRDRLHYLAGDRHAIEQLTETLMEQLATTASVVTDLKAERDRTRIEHDLQQKRWSQRKVVFVTACTGVGAFGALIGATFAMLRFAGYGG